MNQNNLQLSFIKAIELELNMLGLEIDASMKECDSRIKVINSLSNKEVQRLLYEENRSLNRRKRFAELSKKRQYYSKSDSKVKFLEMLSNHSDKKELIACEEYGNLVLDSGEEIDYIKYYTVKGETKYIPVIYDRNGNLVLAPYTYSLNENQIKNYVSLKYDLNIIDQETIYTSENESYTHNRFLTPCKTSNKSMPKTKKFFYVITYLDSKSDKIGSHIVLDLINDKAPNTLSDFAVLSPNQSEFAVLKEFDDSNHTNQDILTFLNSIAKDNETPAMSNVYCTDLHVFKGIASADKVLVPNCIEGVTQNIEFALSSDIITTSSNMDAVSELIDINSLSNQKELL